MKRLIPVALCSGVAASVAGAQLTASADDDQLVLQACDVGDCEYALVAAGAASEGWRDRGARARRGNAAEPEGALNTRR